MRRFSVPIGNIAFLTIDSSKKGYLVLKLWG